MSGSSTWLIIASLLGGGLIAAQGPIYARMSSHLGSSVNAAMLAFVVATLAIVLVAILMKTQLPTFEQLGAMPKWVWLGALVGVYQVLVSIAAVPALGVGSFVLIVVFGQIFASQIYDQFGWFGMEQRSIDLKSAIGMIVMGGGLLLVTWR